MLVALAAIGWELETIMNGRQFCDDFYTCASFEDLGVEPPAEWAAELHEIRDADAKIYRFQGRLTAEAMESDLVLAPALSSDMPWASNVYGEHLGDCDEIGPYSFCSMSGRPGIGWLALAALLVGAGALLALRRRR
jgi:hypothetical protein